MSMLAAWLTGILAPREPAEAIGIGSKLRISRAFRVYHNEGAPMTALLI
jgi:hypothetical protein